MPLASEFRARARRRMEDNIFSNTWLMALVVLLIESAIITISGSVGLSLFITGPLSVGTTAVCLRLVRNTQAKVDIEEMFLGFRGDRLLNTFLLGILEFLYLLLWALLFVIPAIIKSYSYAMAYNIYLDNPGMDANDCITQSRYLMDGHKWRLFCLDFSFIGWHLLGLLTCGVVSVWVAPYHRLARAYFYDDLLARARAAQVNTTPGCSA